MSKRALFALAWFALAAGLVGQTGCVTGSDSGSTPATSAGQSCDSLVDSRHKLARRIDMIEHRNGAVATPLGILMVVGAIGGAPRGMGTSMYGDVARKDRDRALAQMTTERTALDGQIDQQQCTAEARAKAGLLTATNSTQDDSEFKGKGKTDAWCSTPTLSLTLRSGKFLGDVGESEKSRPSFDVKGQLYEGGEATLFFKEKDAVDYTDDVNAVLKDGVLTFSARVDPTPKACTYRFALKRQ